MDDKAENLKALELMLEGGLEQCEQLITLWINRRNEPDSVRKEQVTHYFNMKNLVRNLYDQIEEQLLTKTKEE